MDEKGHNFFHTTYLKLWGARFIQALGTLSSGLAEQDLNGFVFLFMALP